MTRSGNGPERRVSNSKALEAFGVFAQGGSGTSVTRVVREGSPIVIFTIGYERRDGEELISILIDLGIDYLADIRDKPMSRKPDFRGTALRARCEAAGIEYGGWSTLGSTEKQRDRLHATGDLKGFHRSFKKYTVEHLEQPIEELAEVARSKSVALLCYERSHEECHRMVISEALADKLGAGITAIV